MILEFSYLTSAIFFIVGLKLMNSPLTARRGNLISSIGMLIAVIATLWHRDILSFSWIFAGLSMGTVIGAIIAYRVPMTAMPEMVALLNGFGGLSSLLVGWSVYHGNLHISSYEAFTIYLSILIGGATFSGSMIAWGKLHEVLSGKPLLFRGQQIVNILLISSLLVLGFLYCTAPLENYGTLFAIISLSLLLGVFMVLPIGGADMPVVISLLNSYSGMAASAAGFVLKNNVLIVSGALVGASGIILTQVMCKAMNRSLFHVLFSGFGSVKKKVTSQVIGEIKSLVAKDAYHVLEAAKSIVVVPGYGLAVAQAQHLLKELTAILEKRGADVTYAIHSVAGRMPGHMNVLLAEAGVPYEQLIEMEAINPRMEQVDVCLVIGANDVVNLSARDDTSSSIYGMPIIEVDRAKHVFILKRSTAFGFAGIENPLFFKENSSMIFGDAKQTLQSLVAEFKS